MIGLTFVALCAIFPLSWGLCGLVKRYALRKTILDIPNERSSHSTPTPRGGGLAIAAVFLAFLILARCWGLVSFNIFLALFGGGFLVALTGWLDDCKVMASFRLRLLLHILAACWSLYWLRGLPRLNLGAVSLDLGFGGVILAVLGIVWVTNLYNFMDGIDGLAGTEAVCAGAVAGCLLHAGGLDGLAFLSFALALASLGFLIWNWPKAKIFMGDVGSSFLGFIIASLAVASENSHRFPLLIWAILLGIFLIDATATLIRRVCSKELWYQAHRSHAYQLLIQEGFSHRQVTLAVLFINLALALYAWLAWSLPNLLLMVFVSVFGLLLVLYIAIWKSYRLRLFLAGEQLAITKSTSKTVGR